MCIHMRNLSEFKFERPFSACAKLQLVSSRGGIRSQQLVYNHDDSRLFGMLFTLRSFSSKYLFGKCCKLFSQYDLMFENGLCAFMALLI